ncbi:MAG: bifunctional ornithine acetyltransferase/N-acetylglutamate synthase [Candidatus Omnitrophica bacterium CG1_02_44_16]|nr:MAG: bifunctional ornithine acetyltransferase/N-acetylglutamate synthase [Candidatus Omnitrophica bacterium CG1_02_44_16]
MSLQFNSGILPIGFKACGIAAKIKKSGKKDLALFYSSRPCAAAGLFTSNCIKAAPLEISLRHLKNRSLKAVIVNSGNANCMTGRQGLFDAIVTTQLVARSLKIDPGQVLVSSTGIIGKPLPMEKIKAAVPILAKKLSIKGLSDAASAILTTDTFQKQVTKIIQIGSRRVVISGVAKGAGMIAPQMKACPAGRPATMLAYIFTDATVTKHVLKKALKDAVDVSFNAITIDGCMSTNDTVVAMANGASDSAPIKNNTAGEITFCLALKEVCLALAKMIVHDAEGATKFIEIRVKGAVTYLSAKHLAFSVANSNLFKCAMFGSDPNWGRIAAALGSIPSALKAEKLDIDMNKKPVFRNGKPVPIKNNNFLRGSNVLVDIDLHAGRAKACVYTSDLSYGYVRINADYN